MRVVLAFLLSALCYALFFFLIVFLWDWLFREPEPVMHYVWQSIGFGFFYTLCMILLKQRREQRNKK